MPPPSGIIAVLLQKVVFFRYWVLQQPFARMAVTKLKDFVRLESGQLYMEIHSSMSSK